ncbi:MAG: heterodisulfide reductase-related iron-sulfur binding cluster [Desulfovibrionales bacterium]
MPSDQKHHSTGVHTVPDHLIGKVLTACGSCEDCRSFMEESCLFFAELFRLQDRRRETGVEPGNEELHRLTTLCTMCGLCPCADIRNDILAAKHAYARRDGLALSVRVLQDVDRFGTLCSRFPRASRLMTCGASAALIKRGLGIHPDRTLPAVPAASFDRWVRHRDGVPRQTEEPSRTVAYFPGCTARFFFPEVARAAVEVLEAFGARVIVLQGTCCGMPPLLEGDQDLALKRTAQNLKWMAEQTARGINVVCSCPTCGYLFKRLVSETAYFSEAYQHLAGGDENQLRIPANTSITGPREGDMVVLSRAIYGRILKDSGVFSELDPLERIAVSEGTFDLGEYLAKLAGEGSFLETANPMDKRVVYYPPCHLREQKIGSPFVDLLRRIPRLEVTPLTGSLDCCGMAGIMGYKKEFHQESLRLGTPLMDTIRSHHPEMIVTDCLSCRLQFEHLDTILVRHPVELLREAIVG